MSYLETRACIFCQRSEMTILAENEFAYAIRDKFPMRPLHTLIIPKRHVTDIFASTADEREAIHKLAMFCRETICNDDPTVSGFNFGSNVGAAAGQKVFHAHIHLIPRRSEEAELPPAGRLPGSMGGARRFQGEPSPGCASSHRRPRAVRQ